ncbi:MAG: HAD family hydrolase [Treponema sp.]|nr:HAD family hydrolase [Treponema sp.]
MDRAERGRLVGLIKNSSPPLLPQPPRLPPEWERPKFSRPLTGIKAVLFDVYGTLFCSAAGDIGSTVKAACENAALEALAREYGLTGKEMTLYFREQAALIHGSMPVQYPEIRAEEIWTDFLRRREMAGGALCGEKGRELALRFELAVNPVYPMPGALEAISTLRDAGVVLGIISNAQFYTPLLFEAFFNAPPKKLGFSESLIIYSFEMGEAKPSPRLFETAASRLEELDIKAAECAFAGNDMLSDIYGAVNAGFKGVLFAGDSRSLRLREGDKRLKNHQPSLIIQNLIDLKLKLGL